MRVIPLVVLAAMVSSKVAAGDCAMIEYRPDVLTPAATNLGPHGGVVIAQLAFAERVTETRSETWRFRTGSHTTPPAITTLAPGLAVYTPSLRNASVVLEAGDHKDLVAVSAIGGSIAELAAPAIKVVKFAESRGRHSSASGWAELTGDPPDGAVALVVFDKAGKARSFGTVVKNAKQVTIYSSSDCGGPFPGTIVSKPGDEIRLAWVDARGALSKQTGAIRVGG